MTHGRCARSCGESVDTLQSLNYSISRVLGHRQLEGHVASIVSMFSKVVWCEKLSTRGVLECQGKDKYLGGTAWLN